MGSVTIAASFGAGGSVVAPAVAARLELPFVDRAIPVGLAERLDHPLMQALAEDERHHNAVRYLLDRAIANTGLFLGVPTPLDHLGADRHVAATEDAIRHLAEGSGAVILGRAAVFVLAGRPNVLHVHLDGPMEARRAQAMAHDGLDYRTASARQQRADRARAAYISHFHPEAGDWQDLRHYHLTIDSTAISLDLCVDVISRAARELFARTAAPQQPAR
jgi:cytidylate kinase